MVMFRHRWLIETIEIQASSHQCFSDILSSPHCPVQSPGTSTLSTLLLHMAMFIFSVVTLCNFLLLVDELLLWIALSSYVLKLYIE